MTYAHNPNAAMRAILVPCADAAQVAKRVAEYGPVAVQMYQAGRGHVVPVLGPVHGFTVVAVPEELDDFHALNLLGWLTEGPGGATSWSSIGWYGGPGARGPGLVVEVDPNGDGELLCGVRPGGRPFHADLSLPERPALPPEVRANPCPEVPEPLGSWLQERGVPNGLQALGAIWHELSLHAEVRLEEGANANAESAEGLRSQPPTLGSFVSSVLGFLFFGSLAALVSYLAQPQHSDTIALRVLTIGLATGLGLVALQSLGVALLGRGRPYQSRLDSAGELSVSRVILLWRRHIRLNVRQVARVRIIWPRLSTTESGGPTMKKIGLAHFDLRDGRGRRLARFPAVQAPGGPDAFLASLQSMRPDLRIQE